MASPFQQQALQRKIVYIGLIAVRFTAAWAWRSSAVEPQAEALALREEDVGKVELSGSAIRLGLIGSRGLVTCGLWMSAIEKQKKNQWNELEILVRTLTKLQPHFITPWLFQSWNLAFNVSVESDRVRDKFYYVTRGVSLLAEGERQNKSNPDLRFNLGFYNQLKICTSDEKNYMRSLFQLSCIAPRNRDLNKLRRVVDGQTEVNLAEFETFCQEHPQLVRRLRDTLRCNTPEDVVQFLKDNENIPSLYIEDRAGSPQPWEQGPLHPVFSDPYPILP